MSASIVIRLLFVIVYVNDLKNIKLHVGICLANPINANKGMDNNMNYFFNKGIGINLGMIVKENCSMVILI